MIVPNLTSKLHVDYGEAISYKSMDLISWQRVDYDSTYYIFLQLNYNCSLIQLIKAPKRKLQ